MNRNILARHSSFEISADQMIADVIIRSDSELQKVLSDTQAAPQNDFTSKLIAAIKAEQARRAAGIGPTKKDSWEKQYAAMLKHQTDAWILRFLSGQIKIKNDGRYPFAEQQSQLEKRIIMLKEELKARGIKYEITEKGETNPIFGFGMVGLSAILGAGSGYFIAKAINHKGWHGAAILGIAAALGSYFIFKPGKEKAPEQTSNEKSSFSELYVRGLKRR